MPSLGPQTTLGILTKAKKWHFQEGRWQADVKEVTCRG
jgi:hypothetical protein